MRKSEHGGSLVETMIAVLISLIVISQLGHVIFTATVQNKNQGVEMSRVTVYAQDKMEFLLNLNWASCSAATPGAGCNTTGITDTAWNQGLKAGGTLTREAGCPTTGAAIGYLDFLDADGNQFTGADCTAVGTVAYERQWRVTDVITSAAGTPGLKRIDLMVWSRARVNTGSADPSVVLTSFKSE